MKKNINKIIVILIILNALTIGLVFAKSYEKTKTIKLNGNNLISEIKITYDVQANPLSKVEVTDLTNTNAQINGCVGNLGQSIDISGNFFDFQLKEAKVTMKYDENKLGEANETRLGVLWYDKENKQMVAIESDIDSDKNTISFSTDHFSEYIIVDLDEWEEAWHKRVVKVRDGSEKFEIAFVIDDSGSMTSNDPQDLRLEATKNFVEILEEKDKFSIIEFEDSANILQELTSDKNKATEAIEKFGSGGGTNIASGLEKGIEVLDTNSESSRVIVLLTDGEDSGLNSKREELIKKAKDKDIIIFTIFLNTGSNTNQNDTVDIAKIAKDTHGEFYTISSEEVIDIFNRIRKVSVGTDAKEDGDNDGIPDEIEIGGIKNQFGQIIYTNPYSSDTDEDGITDDKEIGSQQTAKDGTTYYPMNSDPTRANESSCEYYKIGPNSQKYEVWDSGFKLNRDAFKFANKSVKGNGGVCAGIGYIIENSYNKTMEKIDRKNDTALESNNLREKETEEALNKKYGLDKDSDTVVYNKNEESIYKDYLNENGYESVIRYNIKGYDVSQKELDIIFENNLPYFYNPGNILNNPSGEVSVEDLKQNVPDSKLAQCLFWYWEKFNSDYFEFFDYENGAPVNIDESNCINEETIQDLKTIFSNQKIVTLHIRGKKEDYFHIVNAYALEKRSENEYRLYVYDNNVPYSSNKNQYITFKKIHKQDNYKIEYKTNYGYTMKANKEKENDDNFIAIEFNDIWINFSDEVISIDNKKYFDNGIVTVSR